MLKINLAKRERYVVLTAACLIVLFLLINFLILPFFKEKDRFKKGIALKELELKEIAGLSSEYKIYQKDSDEMSRILAKRGKGFTLLSYLDNAAGEADVKGYIQYMNPSKSSSSKSSGPYKESGVEIKLEGVNIDQLVNYLYEIETPRDLIFIRRMSVTDNKKQEGYLDCVIQVLTYQ
jgi:general secretion pathway protein M